MKIEIRMARVANDNAKGTVVVSLSERRKRVRRRDSLMRDWAPAILATFFGGSPREPPQAR
jgi:hypothetical protein